ncbi:MAG: glycosyltransferase family 39 protein [Candidatus Hydrogenedentes bacterium]|nr:glycosyltransferase family 39 protein [Candidatus Hydrogenedentota bacterium]
MLRRWALRGGIAAILALFVGLSLAYFRATNHPYLFPEGGATWIHFDNSEIEVYLGDVLLATGFRKQFTVSEPVPNPVLSFRAMRHAEVFLNGERIYKTDRARDSWKTVERVELPAPLPPGVYELLFVVTNRNGPPCLIAFSETLNLRTDSTWGASRKPPDWTPAIGVDDPHAYAIARGVPRADRALLSLWPFFLPVFFSVAGVTFTDRFESFRKLFAPGSVRWFLVAAFVGLGVNNLFKLPDDAGFDIEGHMEYVRYVATEWRVPLATEGWTMFQAPLFYFVCAPLYRVFLLAMSDDHAMKALRIVPIVCGALHIDLSYRAVRCVWKERPDLQIVGTILGGLLPLHTYASQYLGNESFAGVFSGWVVVILLGMIYRDSEPGRRATIAAAIAWAGALLSKVTALLLAPALLYALTVRAQRSRSKPWGRELGRHVALTVAVVFIFAGWYFVRNWILLGKPFFGGWEPDRGIIWWQDPGYRTLQQFTAFGTALFYPVCANMYGFWDGLYSTFWADGLLSAALDLDRIPPWNYRLMLSGVWLGLVPSAMMLAGAIRVCQHDPATPALILSLLCVGTFLAGMLYTFAIVPYYCVVKSSYMAGLLPCFAVLGAAGCERMCQHKAARAAILGAFACWAVAAYGAYFIS